VEVLKGEGMLPTGRFSNRRCCSHVVLLNVVSLKCLLTGGLAQGFRTGCCPRLVLLAGGVAHKWLLKKRIAHGCCPRVVLLESGGCARFVMLMGRFARGKYCSKVVLLEGGAAHGLGC
jgi:hypothetical protein